MICASFKALVPRPESYYWRYGLGLCSGKEMLALFHLDSSQFVVVRLGSDMVGRVVWPEPFRGRWHRLQICTSPRNDLTSLQCYLDNALVFTRTIADLEGGYHPFLKAWSDNHMHHKVLIRDIIVQQGGVPAGG